MEGSKFIDRPSIWHEQKLEAQERIMALQFGQVDRRLERIEALIEGLDLERVTGMFSMETIFSDRPLPTRRAGER